MAADFSVSDLARAMDHASDEIKREVAGLVDAAAYRTQSRVQAAYPVGPTGTLRSRVIVTQPRRFQGGPVPPRQVRATAPHVHIWQEGTRDRFDATRGNAYRGRSPRHGRVFEAIAAQERREMLQRAEDLLRKDREL